MALRSVAACTGKGMARHGSAPPRRQRASGAAGSGLSTLPLSQGLNLTLVAAWPMDFVGSIQVQASSSLSAKECCLGQEYGLLDSAEKRRKQLPQGYYYMVKANGKLEKEVLPLEACLSLHVGVSMVELLMSFP